VLSFSPVVGIGTSSPPHPQASVPPPPPVPGEGHTRWRERGWESPNSDEGTYTLVLCKYMYFVGNRSISHWPLPAVRDLPCDCRVVYLRRKCTQAASKVSIRGKCARTGHPLKIPSPTKLARLGHFPPASQACRLAGPVFYTVSFLWVGV
jgi:hypothetical protein